MFKSASIKVLSFGPPGDQKTFPVDALSKEIQDLVEHFNELNIQDAKLSSELFTLRLAKAQLQTQIETVYKAEQAKAAAEAAKAAKAAEAVATPVAEPPVG